MRDFIVGDPDGHRFVLGRGQPNDTALRSATDYYGLDRNAITANPPWREDRAQPRWE